MTDIAPFVEQILAVDVEYQTSRSRIYRERHREQVSRTWRIYRVRNRRKCKDNDVAYYRAHRTEILERKAEYRRTLDKQAVSSYNASYYEANKDRILKRKAERLAKKKEES